MIGITFNHKEIRGVRAYVYISHKRARELKNQS